MIVNATEKGWEVIFQRAHELLAVHIGWHWRTDLRPARWIETITALGDHDNQQDPWQGRNHLTKTGAPLDFSKKEFSLQQAQNVVEVARYKSVYVALLISMHVNYLYHSMRGQSSELDQFLDEQEVNQQKWRRSLNMSKQEAEAAYRLLHWCDRCSLILCRRQLPEDERKLEVFQGPEGRTYQIWERSGGEGLCVEPWPFETKHFEVRVEARTLEQLSFENDSELSKALLAAKVEERCWIFKK